MERIKLRSSLGTGTGYILTREILEEVWCRKDSIDLISYREKQRILTFTPEKEEVSSFVSMTDAGFILVGVMYSRENRNWGVKWGRLTGQFDKLLRVHAMIFESQFRIG